MFYVHVSIKKRDPDGKGVRKFPEGEAAARLKKAVKEKFAATMSTSMKIGKKNKMKLKVARTRNI